MRQEAKAKIDCIDIHEKASWNPLVLSSGVYGLGNWVILTNNMNEDSPFPYPVTSIHSTPARFREGTPKSRDWSTARQNEGAGQVEEVWWH